MSSPGRPKGEYQSAQHEDISVPESTHAPILAAKRLGFSYASRHVFTGWSADFGPGLTWVRGSNGSGKSTLLQLLGGVLPPQTGELSINGIDAKQQPIDYRREVFWCGAGTIAFDHLRPLEYFGFMRSLYPRFDERIAREHVSSLGLDPHLEMRLSQLSTGTQRKVWLATALSVNTSAVLIDEPVNALDANALDHLHRALMHCAADPERAWIVTSHEPLGPAGDKARCIDLP